MKKQINRSGLIVAVGILCLGLGMPDGVRAATITNAATGNYTFGTAANWAGGVVPGAADSVVITDMVNAASIFLGTPTTNANVTVTLSSGSRELLFNGGPWWVTNTFNFGGGGAGGLSRLTGSGVLVVTNSDGTATFNWQTPGGGPHFIRDGGSLTANHFYTLTNAPGAISQIYLSYGTLTTLGHSEIDVVTGLYLAQLGPATWNILGGTNKLVGAGLLIGGNAIGTVLVSGSNSVLQATGQSFDFSYNGVAAANGSRLIVSNGATANFGGGFITKGSNMAVVVTGSNSTLNLAGQLYLGYVGAKDSVMRAENGGRITIGTQAYVGSGGATNVTLMANGGSITGISDLFVGGPNALTAGSGSVIVTNGGTLQASSAVWIGGKVGSYGEVRVAGNGSLLQSGYNGFMVGSNASGIGWLNSPGLVVVSDGGILEPGASLVAGITGSISNRGGVFQFTSATPTVSAQVPGNIVLSNGVIAFRGITDARVFGNVSGTALTNITYQGNNAFRLNNASNNTTTATYNFDTGFGATNYSSLQLAGTGALWRSTSLRIGGGGSLIGNGTVAANVTNAGIIAPGFSAGLLTFTSNLVLGSSSLLDMEIGGTNTAAYDRMIVGGNLSLTGALHIVPINGFSPTPGDTFTLIDNQGVNPISGQFSGLTNNQFIDASQNGMSAYFRIQYDGGTGNDLVLIATIPEPSSLALLGLGTILMQLARRRHSKA